jgi:alkylresorcinol/alkylpyrone synthase
VELCSLTFLPQDRSMTQLVAAALFGDGAAAVVLCGDRFKAAGLGAEILFSDSRLLPRSLDIMGWDFSDAGMRLVLSPRAPRAVETHLEPIIKRFLRKSVIRKQDVDYWLFHPGSSKIIDSSAKALSLAPNDARFSRRFLENFGNLSSASILFILDDILYREKPKRGSRGILAAMGPGFACELVLLRFS